MINVVVFLVLFYELEVLSSQGNGIMDDAVEVSRPLHMKATGERENESESEEVKVKAKMKVKVKESNNERTRRGN